MTMLIAGHETTAAVLTWSVFLLAQVHKCYYRMLQVINFFLNIIRSYCAVMQSPTKMRKAQAEVDSVLSNEAITVESLKKLEYVTCVT